MFTLSNNSFRAFSKSITAPFLASRLTVLLRSTSQPLVLRSAVTTPLRSPLPSRASAVLVRHQSHPFSTATMATAAAVAAAASTTISAQKYTPAEEAEIKKWVAVSESIRATTTRHAAAADLDALDAHLTTRTTILGSKPSAADVSLYRVLATLVAEWSPDERTGQRLGRPNIVRHLDFVQNSPAFELAVADADKIAVDRDDVRYVRPVADAKAEKERLKKEKAAAAAAATITVAGDTGATADAGGAGAAAAASATGQVITLVDRTRNKAEELAANVKEAVTGGAADEKPAQKKKEKAPKQAKPAPPTAVAAAPLSPCLIDLRVGHILKAINHPDADSLYISTIAVGDKPGAEDTVEHDGQVCRTVCSGLNGLVPLDQMQGRKVVVVCNLKPVKMRGVKSCAMVLAASPRDGEAAAANDHAKGPVELVAPPEASKAGDRVFFHGWKGEPHGVLNPKKKIWETLQPGFTTTDALEVAFDAAAVEALGKTDLGKLVTESGDVCTVQTLRNAVIR